MTLVPAASPPKKDDYMSQAVNRTPLDDDLRAEYDETVLKNGVRGKYAQRYAAGTNLVRLAPDVAVAFPTEEAVNEALRLLLKVAQATRHVAEQELISAAEDEHVALSKVA